MKRHRIMSLLLCLAAFPAAGCKSGGYRITPVPLDQRFEETVVMADPGWFVGDKVLLLDVSGLLINAKPRLVLSEQENPVAAFMEKLRKAESDPRVKAIVLRINSPGGGVAAADMMYQELLRVKKGKSGKGKPVVAMMMDVAASGGYYVACAADEIVAGRGSVTGSIGVIMQMIEVQKGLQMIGVNTDAIKSGPNKDAGSPLRKMKPEERKIFQQMVNEYYQQFLEVVAKGRPKLEPEQIKRLADGRVYTGKQALEAGLVDRLGTLRDAIAAAKQRADIKKCKVVMYHRPLEHRGSVYARSPQTPPTVNLINLQLPGWLNPSTPRFMYLWAPGS